MYQAAVTPNLIKPFSIAGFIFGEIYMLFTVLGPDRSGMEVPWTGIAGRLVGAALFLGPCGAAAGMGVGMLVMVAITLWRRARHKLASGSKD